MGEKYSEQVSGHVSKKVKSQVDKFILKRKIPLSRIIAIALENELQKGEDAFAFDFSLPSEEYVEYAFADQAAKILKFITTQNSIGLDMLLILRHDIFPDGIDRETFLLAFRELVEKQMVERCEPYVKNPAYETTYCHWKLAKEFRPVKVRVARRRANDFETYLKLSKKFKGTK